jgi:hypothetical protein
LPQFSGSNEVLVHAPPHIVCEAGQLEPSPEEASAVDTSAETSADVETSVPVTSGCASGVVLSVVDEDPPHPAPATTHVAPAAANANAALRLTVLERAPSLRGWSIGPSTLKGDNGWLLHGGAEQATRQPAEEAALTREPHRFVCRAAIARRFVGSKTIWMAR